MALLTGLRGAIPEHVWLDMQLAGIAHLLAISGLHLGMVAGTLFFSARLAMALAPASALRLQDLVLMQARFRLALVGELLCICNQTFRYGDRTPATRQSEQGVRSVQGVIKSYDPVSRDGIVVRDTDLSEVDLAPDAFKYLDAKQGSVAGVPTLLLRIGFVGELGYELHFPSPHGETVWDALAATGATPFGLEPQRILRLEKMHVLIGQDTDSESNALEASMPWIVKFEKDEFVGKWALEHVQERGMRDRLVGFEMQNGSGPPGGRSGPHTKHPGNGGPTSPR